MTDNIRVSDLVRYDPARNCFVLKGAPMQHRNCNCHPDSPFHWRERSTPSIFAQDHTFCPKGAKGQTAGQMQTDKIEERRANGEAVGYLHGIGQQTVEKEKRLLAYKQFGIYSKAKPSIKNPNKHEK